MKRKIGMVGIGLMGHGIASNLIKHGHELAVFEHPGNQPLDDLKAKGAVGLTRLRDVADRSDVVIFVLTGSPQVEAVLTGPACVMFSAKHFSKGRHSSSRAGSPPTSRFRRPSAASLGVRVIGLSRKWLPAICTAPAMRAVEDGIGALGDAERSGGVGGSLGADSDL